MKYVKMLGLAAVAAMALMAFIGASSASATVLCKEANTTGCSAAGKDYAAGTVISASLDTGNSAVLKTTGGFIENTCTTSTVEGPTVNTGGATETVSGTVEAAKLTFSNCSNTTDVTAGGELEIHWISGTDNGTLTAKNFQVTQILAGITCTYGAGTSTDLGTVTGGSPATLDVNAVVNKTAGGFACPSTAIWEAKYTVTSPTPLYVSEK
jgi:hypothetical protein